MNKSISKRTLISIIGLILSIAIIYFISYSNVIKPIQAELASTNKNVALFETQMNKLGKVQSGGDGVDEKVTTSIPGSAQPDKVLLSIGKLASRADVIVNLIESGNVENTESAKLPDGIKKNNYMLEGTATGLENVHAFLTSLKKSDRLIVINKLTVNKIEKDVSFMITFSTFHTLK